MTLRGRAVNTSRGRAWSSVHWALVFAFLLTAGLNLAQVSGGFLTNYLADATVPALLYVLARELAPGRRLALPRLTAWMGRTPERAAVVLLAASIATELSQAAWPHGLFSGRFDPWDMAAYSGGLAAVYVGDRWGGFSAATP